MNEVLAAITQLSDTPALDKLHAALCRKGTPLEVAGTEIEVFGKFYKGCGIGYSRHGEPIDPPEPDTYEIEGLYIGGKDVTQLIADYAGGLWDHIETQMVEANE